jgi:DNA-damage-inducible protein D
METQLTPFEGQQIRKIEYNGEWYFSVVDVISVLTNSPIPRNYWSILKKREPQLHTSCMQLKLTASDGKIRPTDCANTEGVFRIIMSVPSPKAEPLKQWLRNVHKSLIINKKQNILRGLS